MVVFASNFDSVHGMTLKLIVCGTEGEFFSGEWYMNARFLCRIASTKIATKMRKRMLRRATSFRWIQ